MERKCQKCKNKIVFDVDDFSQVIRFEKSFYHYDCFIDLCNTRVSQSNAHPKWKKALDSIDKIKKETDVFIKGIVGSPRDQLYRFILESYNVTTVSSFIFQRLQGLYDGSYIGTSRPIPPEDLLDMWKQKMQSGYLDRLRAKNIVKGRDMTVDQKISYDLTVLINKYDDYLRWKEKSKIIEQDVNNSEKDVIQPINLDKLSKIAQSQSKNDNEDDINSLLDELFD